jgi:hypothetical protein
VALQERSLRELRHAVIPARIKRESSSIRNEFDICSIMALLEYLLLEYAIIRNIISGSELKGE